MAVTTLAIPTPVPGEIKLDSAMTWYPLKSVSKPCTKVRLSAPTANSPAGVINGNSILIVESTTMPTTTAGAWELPNTATGLNYTLVSDANLIWLYALNAGDAVEYSIQ